MTRHNRWVPLCGLALALVGCGGIKTITVTKTVTASSSAPAHRAAVKPSKTERVPEKFLYYTCSKKFPFCVSIPSTMGHPNLSLLGKEVYSLSFAETRHVNGRLTLCDTGSEPCTKGLDATEDYDVIASPSNGHTPRNNLAGHDCRRVPGREVSRPDIGGIRSLMITCHIGKNLGGLRHMAFVRYGGVDYELWARSRTHDPLAAEKFFGSFYVKR